MKTLIIYNHPYEGSYNHAILESVVKGISRAQGKYEVIDLDKENFNPVMTSADLLGFVKHQAVDPIAISYAEKIKEADYLVFIFPIWWEMMPALTKGFIDKVIYPGLTYDYYIINLDADDCTHKIQLKTEQMNNNYKIVAAQIINNNLF